MRRSRLIAGAAVGVAAWATWIALTSHHGSGSDNDTFAVLLPLNGLTSTWTGLYAWQRRPDERLGPLMVALGFAFMAQGLLFADSALPFTLGLIVSPLWGAVFVHLVLSAPDGRLRTTAARRGGHDVRHLRAAPGGRGPRLRPGRPRRLHRRVPVQRPADHALRVRLRRR